MDPYPTLLDPVWGFLVRLCARLPGGNAALWTGWLAAGFGALCVALDAALMMRVRYPIHDAHDPDETGREATARGIAGLASGLFLMLNVPFWIMSTRSLPGTFHLAMLLSAAWLFSEYQRTGRTSRLYLLGLLYGVGIVEFATFWVFAPLAALLVARAMLQRAEFSVRVLVRTGLCVLPGLLLYVANAWRLWQDPAIHLRGFSSPWSVVWFTWRDQWNLIAHAPQTTGFLMVMTLTVVPWGVMYLMRPKKPAWRYSAWQTFLRLVVLAAALAALFNAPLSPWRYFGMNYLIATPYLILAVCAGGVAGEFWVMGQVRGHRGAGIGQPLRSLMGIVGLLVPIAAAAAGTDFGLRQMGTAVTNTLAITNSGAVTLTILGVRTNGAGAASFRAAGLPATLGAGQQTNVQVVFAPAGYGRRTAALVLSNNSAEASFAVNLAGDGLTTLARNGPLAGGNVLTVTNAAALGNGSDITNVTVGGVRATILAQGTHYVVFTVPAGAVAGAVDMVIQSASIGATTLDDAYLYHPAGSIFGAPGVAAGWTNFGGIPPWWRLDQGFAHDGTAPWVAAQSDSGLTVRRVYRWSGSFWIPLARTFTNEIDVLLHDGTNLYVGVEGGVDVWNGSTWTTRGGLNGRVVSLARNGSTLYAGLEVATGASNIVYEWAGSAWSAIGAAGDDREWEVKTLLHDGSHLYAGGYFHYLNGVYVNGAGRWDGSAWEPLVAGPVFQPVEGEGTGDAPPDAGYFDGSVLDVEKVGGNLYVGGDFTEFGSSPSFQELNRVARWTGNDWTNVGTGLEDIAYALATDGTHLYAGGYFTNAGGRAASRVAKWTGSAWTNLGLGVNGPVQNILWTNGELYVMGSFYEAGGIPAEQVAKWTDGRPAGTGVAPETGSMQGGYRVAISGTNLGVGADVTNVVLCGVGVQEIVSQSVTQVVVVAGTSTKTGTGHVRVYSTSHGMTVRSNAFTYLDVPAFKLSAVALTNSVMLRWPNPQTYGWGSGVVNLRYSASEYPATTNAGTGVYTGSGQVFEHTGRTPGQACYYSLFVSDDGILFEEP